MNCATGGTSINVKLLLSSVTKSGTDHLICTGLRRPSVRKPARIAPLNPAEHSGQTGLLRFIRTGPDRLSTPPWISFSPENGCAKTAEADAAQSVCLRRWTSAETPACVFLPAVFSAPECIVFGTGQTRRTIHPPLSVDESIEPGGAMQFKTDFGFRRQLKRPVDARWESG